MNEEVYYTVDVYCEIANRFEPYHHEAKYETFQEAKEAKNHLPKHRHFLYQITKHTKEIVSE